MNEDFIFRLGADVSSFTKSITEVEAELKSARQAIKGALGDDLVKGNTYVEALEQSLKDLKATGVQIPGAKQAAESIKNIAPAAQKAQNTLTGLSGVVRDLPFGFIAIQNNLPILADQFTSLSKESGGVGGALKNLGGALIGPAGVAFAFGAVTSIVTGLIQEYGSLGEAINVILGITKPLTEAQKAYNKASFETAGNVAAEEAKVNILTKTLLDNKKPQADRLAAYGELKKVAPDVVAGISDENALTDASNILIAANSKLRAESVRLKVQEAGITAALTTNETKIAELRAKLVKADEKYVKSAAALNKEKQQGIITGFASKTAEEAALDAFNNSANAVSELRAQIKVLTGENQTYLNQLDPVVLGIAGINEQTREQIKNLKKQEENTKGTATATENYGNSLKKGAEGTYELATANNALSSSLTGAEATIKANTYFFQKWNEAIGETKRSLAQALALVPKQLPTTAPAVNPNQANIAQQSKEASDALKMLNKEANLEAATNLINETFFSPLQNLFSDLISGADGAFKAFAKAVLQAINQIVAKIIATGIIQLLITLASGGFGAAEGGFAGGIKTVLKGIGKSLGFGGIANPNFSGVGAGALNMAGAVNVVLRGQDLVGSLNRTNAQISRVG